MKTKNLIAIATTFMVAIVGLTSVTFAAPRNGSGPREESQLPHLEGILKDFNIKDNTFKLDTVNGDNEKITVSFTYLEKTVFIRNQEKSTEKDFKDGEKVNVAGKINFEEKTGEAHVVCFGAFPDRDPGKPPMIKGIISKINTEDKTFTLTAKDPENNEVIFSAIYLDRTKFMRELHVAKASDFKDGEAVTVMGMIDLKEKKISAMAVFFGMVPGGPGGNRPNRGPRAIPGTIKKINFEKKTFDLALNEERTITVEFFDWTKVMFNNELVHWKTLKNDMRVSVVGPIDPSDKSIEAHNIFINPANRPGNPGGTKGCRLEGTISALDTENNTFVLTTVTDSKKITVSYNKNTKFFRDGKVSSEDDFANDEKVFVGGQLSEDKLEAFMIIFGDLPGRSSKRNGK
ncbi:MAG: hypothetical protein KAH01_04615 [Caldisericia bacterium]|nr:hypothetical protein [Caldisericia bacterium]